MNKLTTETDLIDYLAGELTADRRAEVTAALTEDASLFAKLAELRALMDGVANLPEPEPSVVADERFLAMLNNASEGLRQNSAGFTSGLRYDKRPSGLTTRVRSLGWKLAGVAAAIALIFTAGRFYENGMGSAHHQELAATRTLMLELMKDERTSARIRATTVTFEMTETDPVTTANLGYLLRNDDNANVRLAALEALQRFVHDPGVRTELLAAMAESPPAVVRFELIETLVRANERRVLPYLEDLMDADTLPQPVRDAAQMAAFKLI